MYIIEFLSVQYNLIPEIFREVKRFAEFFHASISKGSLIFNRSESPEGVLPPANTPTIRQTEVYSAVQTHLHIFHFTVIQ